MRVDMFESKKRKVRYGVEVIPKTAVSARSCPSYKLSYLSLMITNIDTFPFNPCIDVIRFLKI